MSWHSVAVKILIVFGSAAVVSLRLLNKEGRSMGWGVAARLFRYLKHKFRRRRNH